MRWEGCNVRKRSKYRPKGVIMDPMAYVKESLSPVEASYLLALRIRNHAAMMALTQGKATRDDIDLMIAMANMTEALYRMGLGRDYAEEVRQGLDALYEVGRRGASNYKFVLRANEMGALNTLMELHDALAFSAPGMNLKHLLAHPTHSPSIPALFSQGQCDGVSYARSRIIASCTVSIIANRRVGSFL
jgi:hypothetical protein